MKNIKYEIQELKNIQSDFFKLIVELEAHTPISSDELHEQIKILQQYERTLLGIDTKLRELYIKLGSKKLTDELFEASQIGGKDLLFETARKQMQAMNFSMGFSPNEDK